MFVRLLAALSLFVGVSFSLPLPRLPGAAGRSNGTMVVPSIGGFPAGLPLVLVVVPFLFLLFLSNFSRSTCGSPISYGLAMRGCRERGTRAVVGFGPFCLPLGCEVVSPRRGGDPNSFRPELGVGWIIYFLRELKGCLFDVFPLSFGGATYS